MAKGKAYSSYSKEKERKIHFRGSKTDSAFLFFIFLFKLVMIF